MLGSGDDRVGDPPVLLVGSVMIDLLIYKDDKWGSTFESRSFRRAGRKSSLGRSLGLSPSSGMCIAACFLF